MSPLNTHSITSAAKRARALFTLVALTVWLVLEALTAPVALAAVPGDLDTSFGGDGKVTLDVFLGSDDEASAAAIQSDGKIVVAGSWHWSQGDSTFALARFNPNGSVDTSFGSGGRTVTAFRNYEHATANAVAIQRDGKIVVAGGAYSANGDDFTLARYNPNGTLDTTFSGDGMLTTDFGEGEHANAVAIQRDGKIVVAGDDGDDFALARYNTNGTLDTTFSGDGKVLTGFAGGRDLAHAVAIQPDGKIVAAGGELLESCGLFSCETDVDFALARYNPNGTLDTRFDGDDTSFDVDGKAVTDFGEDEHAYAVAIQRDGKIVAAGGQYGEDNGDDFALARYNTNGSLDDTFGGDGKVDTSIVGENLLAYGVAIQSDGKIVAAGKVASNTNPEDEDFETIRYNTDGKPDTSFDGNGLQATDFGDGDRAHAVAIQPDGRIVAVGETEAGSAGGWDFALARYHA